MGVFVWGRVSGGVSVWGESLSRGSLSGNGLCPGSLCPGVICQGDPHTVTREWYVSYWNLILVFLCSNANLAYQSVMN